MNTIENPNFVAKKDLHEKTGECNIYGKEKFSPEKAKEYVESMIDDFKVHYSSLGYREENSILISSGVDPTVRFIGSQISVLKPYFLEKRVPSPGIFMRQDCIRTKNLDRFLDDDFMPAWGSYFPNMGAIAPPERIFDGCQNTFDFFEKKLQIDPGNILIRISSTDQDLMDACRKRYGDRNLEIDSRDISYYRHKLGIEGVWGRNCNIALRNFDGEGFSDVGNLIIIENSESELCLEMSIGPLTSLKQIFGLDHVQDCNPVAGLESVDKKFRRKFEDSIITSTVLMREGLRPFGQHNRNRILKRYIQSMSYFRSRCAIKIEELSKIISDFENREFPKSDINVSGVIVEFLKAFENEIASKKDLTEEQQKIKSTLLLDKK